MAKPASETHHSPGPLIQALYSAQHPSRRATLARLRRGLGKQVGEPGAAERDGWVLRHLGRDVSRTELDCSCLLASLFAIHPEQKAGVSVGSAFRQLWKEHDEAEGPERRMVALLNCDPEDLQLRLRQAVSLLAANDIPIDWQQLLQDLRRWSFHDRPVQRRWARDFWGSRNTSQEHADH